MSNGRPPRLGPGMSPGPQPSTSGNMNAPTSASPTSGGLEDAIITRTETVQAPPLQSDIATQHFDSYTATVRSSAHLGLEHIVSSPSWGLQFGVPFGKIQGTGIHALPIYIDEVEQLLGVGIYTKMLYDSVVRSSDNDLRDSILDKPVQVLSYCDGKDEAEVDEATKTFAAEVAAFVRANLEKLPGGFDLKSRELLSAMSLGYSLGEQTYELKEIIRGNGPQTCLAELSPKPHEAVSIIVDQYNHVLCYRPRLQGMSMTAGVVLGDLGVTPADGLTDQGSDLVEIPDAIPPEKVARFTWMPQNDDPRGTSHLRAAYVPWRLKIGLYPAYEAYLARFAQPSAKLELEGADPMPIQDENGQLVSDPAQIVQKLLMGLRNYQAGGAIVVPVGKMGLEEANSNGDAYLKAYELCNEEITLAILGANLSTQGGKYGTQALGEVHQDTVGHMVSHGKAWYIQTVTEQIIKPLVLYNYGEEGLQVLPRISIGETEQQDFPATAGAIASLLATPILTPHVFNKLLEMLHLPLLPDDVITTLIGKWDAETAAAVTMAENPMGAPGQDPNAEGGEPQPGDGEGAPQDPTSEAANERNYY